MFNSISYLNRVKPRLLKDEGGTMMNQQGQQSGFAQVLIKHYGNKKKDKKLNRRNNAWNQGEARKAICLEGCRYDVVRRMALEMNFEEVNEHDIWNIIWTDTPISLDKALEMRRFQDAHSIFWGTQSPLQKANHFPGMVEICRKDRLARNLNRMKRAFPAEYSFFPKTWALPADISDLLMHARSRKNATYICKPDSGCQGRGIFLIRNLKKLNPFAKVICQVYIPRPLLIDGYKFDLRIYILITSCDPLRIYIYNEGIARFATVKYSPPTDQNVDIVFMHLTNYSLNKFSQSYVPDGEGSKRKLSTVYDFLLAQGHDMEKMSTDIDELIVKTMIAAQPTLRHYYRASFPKHDRGCACFEILGFDILIDADLKPWLLEVNHSPSFNLDLPVDAEVKEALLRDTFNKLYLGSSGEKAANSERKRNGLGSSSNLHYTVDKAGNQLSRALQIQFHHESLRQGNYRLIYPADNCQQYADLFEQNAAAVVDFSQPPRRRPEARAGESSSGKYDYNLPPRRDDYIVTRTIDKNGTVCTTKKSKNISFVMEFDPDKVETPQFNGQALYKSGMALANANNPIVKGEPCYTYQDLEGGPSLFTDQDEFNNNMPQIILDGDPCSPDSSPGIPKKPVRRNIAKQALEIAQGRRSVKDKGGDEGKMPEMELVPKPELDSCSIQGNEKSEVVKKIERLRLPPLRRVSSAQLNKADSNYKVYVSREDQVSVFKYPAVGQDLVSNVPPVQFPLSPPEDEEEIEDTMSLDKYYRAKEPKKSWNHSQSQSSTKTKKSLRKIEKTAGNGNISPERKRFIEAWIQDGARERARELSQGHYVSGVPENSEYNRKQSWSEVSGALVNETEVDETESDKESSYRQLPKIHARSNKGKVTGTLLVDHPSPDLEQEESERKNELKTREKAVKQLGVEAQAFEVVKRSGRLKVEDEYVYNKLFFDEDYHSDPYPTSERGRPSGNAHVLPAQRSKSSKSSKLESISKYRPFATQYQPFFRSPLSSQASRHELW